MDPIIQTQTTGDIIQMSTHESSTPDKSAPDTSTPEISPLEKSITNTSNPNTSTPAPDTSIFNIPVPNVPAPDLETSPPDRPPARKYGTYLERVEGIYEILPHIKDPYSRIPNPKTQFSYMIPPRVDIYDYFDSSEVKTTFGQIPGTFRPIEDLETFLVDSSEIQTRFIIVEDLSYEVINILGDALHLDPEFFAEHMAGILQPKYARNLLPESLASDDLPAEIWPTAGVGKPYFSVGVERPLKISGYLKHCLEHPLYERRNLIPYFGAARELLEVSLRTRTSPAHRDRYTLNDFDPDEMTDNQTVIFRERISVYFLGGGESPNRNLPRTG